MLFDFLRNMCCYQELNCVIEHYDDTIMKLLGTGPLIDFAIVLELKIASIQFS